MVHIDSAIKAEEIYFNWSSLLCANAQHTDIIQFIELNIHTNSSANASNKNQWKKREKWKKSEQNLFDILNDMHANFGFISMAMTIKKCILNTHRVRDTSHINWERKQCVRIHLCKIGAACFSRSIYWSIVSRGSQIIEIY